MCNSNVSLSRSPEEIVRAITSSVNKFFDEDDVKKLYEDYLDAIIAEVKDEYAASNTPTVDDSEIESNKDLFLKYHLAIGAVSFMKAHAKSFDYFMINPRGLKSEQIEELMDKCLEKDHMMTYLKLSLESNHERELLKEIFRGLMKQR